MNTVTLRREDWERIQKALVEFQGWFSHLPEEKTLFTGGRNKIQDELVRLLHLQIIALSIKPVEEGDRLISKEKFIRKVYAIESEECGKDYVCKGSKSEEKKCEHDKVTWWRNPNSMSVDKGVLKRDSLICPFCPKPEERKSPDKVTCFYSSEDKGMIAKWRSLSGFGENTGTAYYELCVALAGAIEILEAERNRGGGK